MQVVGYSAPSLQAHRQWVCSDLAVTWWVAVPEGCDPKETWCSISVVRIAGEKQWLYDSDTSGAHRPVLSLLTVCSVLFTDARIRTCSIGSGGELERAQALQVGYTGDPFISTKISFAHLRAGPVAGTSLCCWCCSFLPQPAGNPCPLGAHPCCSPAGLVASQAH